jgi:hypothetical protein
MIYDELKKRELIDNEKELSELIWLRQIKVNGKYIDSKDNIDNEKIQTITVGLKELHL